MFFISCVLLPTKWIPRKKSDICQSPGGWTLCVCRGYFLVHYKGFWRAVIVCDSVFMLGDTTVACLSSHKWTEDKSIQGGNSFFPFIPSTSTLSFNRFSSFTAPSLCFISCFFFFFTSIWSSFLFRLFFFCLLSFCCLVPHSFPLTSSYPSSPVTFSWFKQCQASLVRANREVSLRLSLCAMARCHTRAGVEALPVGIKWALHPSKKKRVIWFGGYELVTCWSENLTCLSHVCIQGLLPS